MHVVTHHFQLATNSVNGRFFLDLLADEPLQHVVGGVVGLLHGHRDELVDALGHDLLVGQCGTEHFQRRFPFRVRLLNSL